MLCYVTATRHVHIVVGEDGLQISRVAMDISLLTAKWWMVLELGGGG
jgi:hypothetical protein